MISYAQQAQLSCAGCGHQFQADIWMIVDADERPDLVERIKAGELHNVACPQCQMPAGRADAPLLVLRREAEPHLMFSPDFQSTSEQDREHAKNLVGVLHNSLGAEWDDTWIEVGLMTVPRELMPVALSDDPDTAFREWQAKTEAELDRLEREDPEEYQRLLAATQGRVKPRAAEAAAPNSEQQALLDVLEQYVMAQTWGESQETVMQHPELLEEPAQQMLAVIVATAREDGAASDADAFEEHLTLLRRCNEVGIAQAFAEKRAEPGPGEPA